MKAVLLAAGYATRLYPLTLTQPKTLLPVAGRPMIEYVLGHLETIPGVDHVTVVTNDKFIGHFQRWAAQRNGPVPLDVLNDGSTQDSNRRGSLGDLRFALESQAIDDDLLVVAADCLFSQPLVGFGEFCREKNAPVLAVYDVGTLDRAKNFGVVGLDPSGRIRSFIEKPEVPASTLVGIALYYFPRAQLPQLRGYLATSQGGDKLGQLIQWLCPRTPVFTWSVPGLWLDIASKENLEEANRIFAARR
jgi:glucose-1-phosphate thymidylyltransferase